MDRNRKEIWRGSKCTKKDSLEFSLQAAGSKLKLELLMRIFLCFLCLFVATVY